MKRRQFLSASASGLMALSASRLLALDPDNRYRKQIGIQLYTLRNQIDNDVEATLRAVADAGYQQVEMYGFPDCQPMIEAAKAAGLAMHSSHFQWNSVINPDDPNVPHFADILDQARDLGLSHLVIPYLEDRNRGNLDDYRQVAERSNRAAELAQQAGIQLAYHNHAFEFKPMNGGKTGYDVLIEEFSPQMKFEVDIFWVRVGGVDPVALIRKLTDRVSQLHLKDLNDQTTIPSYDGVPEEAFEELGDGTIAMEPVIEVAAEAGVAHCHVEQDQSPDPLASIRQSMAYLKSL